MGGSLIVTGGYERAQNDILYGNRVGRRNRFSRNVLGRTPLSLAKKRGHEAIVQLLERDTEVDTKAFLWAIGEGLETMIRLSIELGLLDASSKQRWEHNPSSWTTQEKKGAYIQLYMERHVWRRARKDAAEYDSMIVGCKTGARSGNPITARARGCLKSSRKIMRDKIHYVERIGMEHGSVAEISATEISRRQNATERLSRDTMSA